ncbi:MAG: hypothetical protein ACLR6J_15310 [Parabacteroides merdae]
MKPPRSGKKAGSEAFDGFTKSFHALHRGKVKTVRAGEGVVLDINGNAAGLCCFDLFLEISAFPLSFVSTASG